MRVDYNSFSDSFAKSRENMHWSELEYFLGFINPDDAILDVGCGSGRFLSAFEKYFGKLPQKYLGVDISKELLHVAQKSYPQQEFIKEDMGELESIMQQNKFKNIFFIASFHHLSSFKERLDCFTQLAQNIQAETQIFMTNWNLLSRENQNKYANNKIENSKNEFGSEDFMIKFGDYKRYYHAFHIDELTYIFQKSGFHVVENRVFDTQRNIISRAQKRAGTS